MTSAAAASPRGAWRPRCVAVCGVPAPPLLQPSSVWGRFQKRGPHPTNAWWINLVLADSTIGAEHLPVAALPFLFWAQADGLHATLPSTILSAGLTHSLTHSLTQTLKTHTHSSADSTHRHNHTRTQRSHPHLALTTAQTSER